jgi:hypothetical protein
MNSVKLSITVSLDANCGGISATDSSDAMEHLDGEATRMRSSKFLDGK